MACPFHGLRSYLGVALVTACALAPAPVRAEAAPGSPAEVALVVRELESAIREARERLIVLVSIPRAKGAMPLHQEPELRQIARELPELERELERWARLETRPSRPAVQAEE
jgi:hypothetical protein